jgi:glutathione peroxidase
MTAIVLPAEGQMLTPPAGFAPPPGLPSIYDLPVKTPGGGETTLAAYRGKKLLIVNVASECGYTYQYEDLQRLHEQLGDRVAVLAFPSNQFGAQEPGDDAAIRAFCSTNYGVTFPVFAKHDVKGEGRSALYGWLADAARNGWNDKEPEWNFNKYLVDENGVLVAWYSSKVKPLDEALLGRLRAPAEGAR